MVIIAIVMSSSNRTKISSVMKVVALTTRRATAGNVDPPRDLHYI